jgi:hypothetical protein
MALLDDLSASPATELQAVLLRLERQELELSARRTRLHTRIDFLRGSGAYDAGTLHQLEQLEAEERSVSRERRVVHDRIDLLRAELRTRAA